MSGKTGSVSFLPHVGGIRAIAILGVFLYHLNAEYCSAGYFGVDMFLVISGYFLFSGLMNPQKMVQFHYGKFLYGKAWRILPSWFVCVFAVGIVSAMLMLGSHALSTLKTAVASSLFFADYYIDHCYDYFNDNARLNPLLHLWYLSITVQLYIVAPLLVVPLLRAGYKKMVAYLLAVLFLLSLSFYLLTTCEMFASVRETSLLSVIGAKSAYYHLIPRFWEVLAGYYVLCLPSFEHRPRLRHILALGGGVGCVASFFIYPTGSPLVYLAVLSCMLLLRYGDTGVCSHFLKTKVMLFIGAISFSLYLWHWPVMVLWKYFCFSEVTVWDEIAMGLLGLMISYAAWKWIESRVSPSMVWGFLQRRKLAAISLGVVAVLLVGCAGGFTVYRRHFLQETRESLLTNAPAPSPGIGDGLLKGMNFRVFKQPPAYCGQKGERIDFMLAGDSHAGHLFHGFHQACKRHGIAGAVFNNSVVPFWNCFNSSTSSLWTPIRQTAFYEYLVNQPSVRYVLIAQFWKYRLEYGPYNSWEYRLEEREKYARGLRETCIALKKLGLKVILLADTPTYPNNIPPMEEWAIRRVIGLDDSGIATISSSEHRQYQSYASQVMEDLSNEGLVHAVIDLSTPLERDGGFPSRIDGQFTVYDSGHLTRKASEIVGDYLAIELLHVMNEDGNDASIAGRTTDDKRPSH